MEFVAKKMTPPTKKQSTPTLTLPTVVKKKSKKIRFGPKVVQKAPTFKSNFPVQVQKQSQRLRVLKASAKAKSTIPKSFLIFKQKVFHTDQISKALDSFCSCPSYIRLFPILHLEIKAWTLFSNNHSQIYGRKTYFHRQIDQKSMEREPLGFCKPFLQQSFICRLLFQLTHFPPKHYRSDESPDFGIFFSTIRKLPHFSRNLVHEIITFCNLGHSHYISARKAQRKLGNSGWKTYQSALNQLAIHFGISFQQLYHQVLQNPSPITDTEIANFCLNAADSKRWINNRSVAII